MQQLWDISPPVSGLSPVFPGIDPADSKAPSSHQTILHYDMRVLENLFLDDVPAGDYELIALPLALTTADASPVRAVLRTLPNPCPTTR